MTKIKPVDNKVFYQAKHKTAEMWQSCSKDDYADFEQMSWMDVRILWPSESVLEKISTTFKKHAAAYEALQKENAAQANRIAELEQEKYVRDLVVTSLHQVVDMRVESLEQYLHATALNKKYIAEIESLRKQVKELTSQNQICRSAMLDFMLANGSEIKGAASKNGELE